MAGWDVDRALTVALLGVAAYFGVLNARAATRYLRFRRMRGEALLAWPSGLPPAYALSLVLGIVSSALTVMGLALHAHYPLPLSQGVTALYFLGVLPLLTSIRPGFYRSGVWVEGGFVPYGEIGRWAFHDTGSVVLMLVRRGHGRALRLPIPADDYGAVRKLLQQKTQEKLLRADPQILDLAD